jgi:ABC-type multidrug transport system ATPase subunit
MTATIEINGLRKRFGPVQALDEMTFTVRPGHVTGFAGPNGAGKSTTVRVVLGLDAPDAGTATTGGRPYRTLENPAACPLTRRRRGSISAERTLPPIWPGGRPMTPSLPRAQIRAICAGRAHSR